MSAHPHHSDERENSALILLDQIIRTLALTAIDSGEPGRCHFSPNTVPVVSLPPEDRDITFEERCFCPAPPASPPSTASTGRGIDNMGLASGGWNPTWTTFVEWDARLGESEIEKEEIRRMCWCALSLAAAHTSQCAALHKPSLDLFIGRPENVCDLLQMTSCFYSCSNPSYSMRSSSQERSTPP